MPNLTSRGPRRTELNGLDLRKIAAPVGHNDIKATYACDADLDELLQFAKTHSPVCRTVCRPVPVVVERVKR